MFTKFPQYLKLFNQFSDLDIERLHENTRLIRHAVKVIDTVTFVVDSLGDETKAQKLNEALAALVQGHLKRKIGLQEFRNLGIVIIDFICDLNNRRTSDGRMIDSCCHQAASNAPNNASSSSPSLLSSSSSTFSNTNIGNNTAGCNSNALNNSCANNNNFSISSSQDSETMTSALDKIRTSQSSSSASSSCSSPSDTGSLGGVGSGSGDFRASSSYEAAEILTGESDTILLARSAVHGNSAAAAAAAGVEDPDALGAEEAAAAATNLLRPEQLDANLLVAAWKKLYGSILDLVKREEEQQQQQE